MRDDDPGPSEATGTRSGLWGKRRFWIAASAAALLVLAGTGLGLASTVRGGVPADARIPLSPARNAVFVEDDDGAGADQQASILQNSAAGVITVRSARGMDVGSGFVITRSGLALASYHGLEGAGTLSTRLVMSGQVYPARLVGSDAAANLALLQLSGGAGFTPVAIGTTAGVHLGDRVASAGGTWAATGLQMTTGGITAIGLPVTLDGRQLTGLLQVSSLSTPASQLGGPLFNLSGQVLGLTIGSGTDRGALVGYVIPIDSALPLARQLAGQ